MRPEASAKPGSLDVRVRKRKWLYCRVSTIQSYQPTKRKPDIIVKPKNHLLVLFLKDLFTVMNEGCLDCFMENLSQKVEGE